MHRKADIAQTAVIAELAGVKKPAELKSVIAIGFGLSDIFRSTTTQLHLVKMGFAPDLERLMKFDPVRRVLEQPVLKKQLFGIVDAIVLGLD
jgi:hypothetical protein